MGLRQESKYSSDLCPAHYRFFGFRVESNQPYDGFVVHNIQCAEATRLSAFRGSVRKPNFPDFSIKTNHQLAMNPKSIEVLQQTAYVFCYEAILLFEPSDVAVEFGLGVYDERR